MGYGAKLPSIDGNKYYHKPEILKKKEPKAEEDKFLNLMEPDHTKISRLDSSSPTDDEKPSVTKFESYITFVNHMRANSKDFKNYIELTSQPFLFNNNRKRRFPLKKDFVKFRKSILSESDSIIKKNENLKSQFALISGEN